MKRIKAMNGYTIMEVTARDEKQGNGTAGEFAVYFSSDIRDYGVAYSTPEFEGLESLELAEQVCNNKFALAKEALEQEYTAVSYDDIIEKAEEMRKTDLETITEDEAKAEIIEAFKQMDDSELVEVWNEYCYSCNMYDDEIFSMDRLNELYENSTPEEIATRLFYGHDEWNDESSFNPNRDWFYLNGYGNPVSVSYIGWSEYTQNWLCSRICPEEIADYIIEHREAFYNDDIAEIIERLEEVA